MIIKLKVKSSIIALCFISFVGCGGNTSERTTLEETADGALEKESEQAVFQLTGRMETGNKCMGYGMVQDGMSGQPQICKFCWMSTNMLMQQGWTGFNGRYGMVDAAFNELPTDYFDYLDSGDGMQTDDGGANGAQIEEEIERHLRNIESLEQQLKYVEGTINSSYLEQQIILEQQEVKRLKRMLK